MPYSILIQVEISQRNAGMAQSVERRIGSAEVTGPIPIASLVTNRSVIWIIKKEAIRFLFYCSFFLIRCNALSTAFGSLFITSAI